MPSTAVPDTHPLAPGLYFIDIQKGHVVGPNNLVTVTDEDPGMEGLWGLNISGRGYNLEHLKTRKYASVAEGKAGAVITLTDEPFMWNIQPDGQGNYRVVFPDKDLYWTEVDIHNWRLFKLWGSDGAKDQMLTFKKLSPPGK